MKIKNNRIKIENGGTWLSELEGVVMLVTNVHDYYGDTWVAFERLSSSSFHLPYICSMPLHRFLQHHKRVR